MLDQKQVRAARALLDWTQETLAERSGIARATIKNVESGATLPRLETAGALQQAFENAGVEFLASSGVRMRDRMIDVLEGPNAYERFLDDAFETAREAKTEILAVGNPSGAIAALGFEQLDGYMHRRREAGIEQRILIPADDLTFLNQPLEVFRILPKDYYSPHPFYVYGSKVALVSLQEPQKAIIINDERFADTARKLFNFIWDRTEMPARQTTKTKTK